MLILGIETSCDETAVSLIEMGGGDSKLFPPRIVAECIASQVQLHSQYGGVVPELASREHVKALPPLFDTCLRQSGVRGKDIDRIAVTVGPGLKGCLLAGVGFVKGLTTVLPLPCGIAPVNHIEGHLCSVFLENEVHFPFLSLVVSGGHTELLLVRQLGKYEVIARTSDDAAGEAFDKSAALLGFPYPGGAALAALADEYVRSSPLHKRFALPAVMRESPGFSFSGLKTAISLLIKRELVAHDESIRGEIARAVQDSIVDALVYKIKKALESTKVRTLAVVGGVAANRALRAALQELPEIRVVVPSLTHCTDNATMIACAGGVRRAMTRAEFSGSGVYPRWPVEVPHAG